MTTCQRGCSGYWDVRSCCELDCKAKNSNEQFYKCPMKLPTICFTLGNDYELYKVVKAGKWWIIKKHFKLNKDELEELKEMHAEEQEE